MIQREREELCTLVYVRVYTVLWGTLFVGAFLSCGVCVLSREGSKQPAWFSLSLSPTVYGYGWTTCTTNVLMRGLVKRAQPVFFPFFLWHTIPFPLLSAEWSDDSIAIAFSVSHSFPFCFIVCLEPSPSSPMNPTTSLYGRPQLHNLSEKKTEEISHIKRKGERATLL